MVITLIQIFSIYLVAVTKNFDQYTVKIGQLGFIYPMIKVTALNQ